MKKLFKLGSLLSLASVLVISGCSCKVKEDKYKTQTNAMGDSDLLKLSNNYVDFTATYTRTTTIKEDVVTETYIVSRDVASDRYKFTKVVKTADNETKISRVVYTKGGQVVIAEIDNDNKLSNEYITGYATPSDVFTEQGSAELYNSGRIDADYYDLVKNTYDNFKNVPYNACLSDTEKSQIFEISDSFSHKRDVTCEVEKPLFGSDYTYTIGYRVSLLQLRKVAIRANDDNKMVYLKVDDTIALNADGTVKNVSNEVKYTFEDLEIYISSLDGNK